MTYAEFLHPHLRVPRPDLTEVYQGLAELAPPCVDDRTEEVHMREPGTFTVTDVYCDFNGVSSTHPRKP